jgi:hypothetical protein
MACTLNTSVDFVRPLEYDDVDYGSLEQVLLDQQCMEDNAATAVESQSMSLH